MVRMPNRNSTETPQLRRQEQLPLWQGGETCQPSAQWCHTNALNIKPSLLPPVTMPVTFENICRSLNDRAYGNLTSTPYTCVALPDSCFHLLNLFSRSSPYVCSLPHLPGRIKSDSHTGSVLLLGFHLSPFTWLLNAEEIKGVVPFRLLKLHHLLCKRVNVGDWESIRRVHGLRDTETRKEKMRRGASLSLLPTLRYEYGNSQSHGDTSQFMYVWNHLSKHFLIKIGG